MVLPLHPSRKNKFLLLLRRPVLLLCRRMDLSLFSFLFLLSLSVVVVVFFIFVVVY